MDPLVALAAALVAAAVLLGWRDPVARLRRVAPQPPPAPAAGQVARLLAGRADAPPLRRRLLLSSAGAVAVCLSLGRVVELGGWPWSAVPVLAVAGAVGLGWLEPLSVRAREQRLVLEAPQALELLAACLAVGAPPRSACAAVVAAFDGPVAEDLAGVLRAVELGRPDADAWLELAGHRQLGPAAMDLARSVESGTRMVESLRTHAETARQHRRARLQEVARSVGVRSVLPLMVCFIPSFLLLGVVPTVVSAVTHAFG